MLSFCKVPMCTRTINSRGTPDSGSAEELSEEATLAKRIITKRTQLDKVHKGNDKTALFDIFLEPDRINDDNPLAWWKANGHKYTLLGHIVRGVVAILAMSAPSERDFSQTTLVIT